MHLFMLIFLLSKHSFYKILLNFEFIRLIFLKIRIVFFLDIRVLVTTSL